MKQFLELHSDVICDKYVDFIRGTFDLEVGDFVSTTIPMPDMDKIKDANLVLICGASGSGKSRILSQLHGGDFQHKEFDSSKPLISNFDMLSPYEASSLLAAMGLASVPTWIRPYNVLSNGERYRADLAMLLADSNPDDTIYIDEYTSVVDRNVAKSMSVALSKYLRRNNRKAIIASCHYDILEWLCPDWIFDLNKGGVLERGDYLRRPTISLQVHRTTSDTWKLFKKHHYMTEDLNKSAHCFVFTWNNQIVAFTAVISQPSGFFKRGMRGHRTVVLPDFQGMGIGRIITDFMGGIYKARGYRYFTKTVNPRLGEYRQRSRKWIATAKNGRPIRPSESRLNKHQKLRASYCYEYVGDPIYGYENITLSAEDMRKGKSMKNQLTLFDF